MTLLVVLVVGNVSGEQRMSSRQRLQLHLPPESVAQFGVTDHSRRVQIRDRASSRFRVIACGLESDDGDWVDSVRYFAGPPLMIAPVGVLRNSRNVAVGTVVDTRCAPATESKMRINVFVNRYETRDIETHLAWW